MLNNLIINKKFTEKNLNQNLVKNNNLELEEIEEENYFSQLLEISQLLENIKTDNLELNLNEQNDLDFLIDSNSDEFIMNLVNNLGLENLDNLSFNKSENKEDLIIDKTKNFNNIKECEKDENIEILEIKELSENIQNKENNSNKLNLEIKLAEKENIKIENKSEIETKFDNENLIELIEVKENELNKLINKNSLKNEKNEKLNIYENEKNFDKFSLNYLKQNQAIIQNENLKIKVSLQGQEAQIIFNSDNKNLRENISDNIQSLVNSLAEQDINLIEAEVSKDNKEQSNFNFQNQEKSKEKFLDNETNIKNKEKTLNLIAGLDLYA